MYIAAFPLNIEKIIYMIKQIADILLFLIFCFVNIVHNTVPHKMISLYNIIYEPTNLGSVLHANKLIIFCNINATVINFNDFKFL